MTIEKLISTDRVEPTDLGHRVGKAEFRLSEVYRRMAIYEKRLLILEGKRPPDRADDERDAEELERPLQDVTRDAETVTRDVTRDAETVTRDASAGVTRYANAAERQRRYRQRRRELPRPTE